MKRIPTLAAVEAAITFALGASAQVFAPVDQPAQVAPAVVDPPVRLDLAAAHAARAPYGHWATTNAYGDVWTPSVSG